jgi:hypothetical protein
MLPLALIRPRVMIRELVRNADDNFAEPDAGRS